MWPIAELKITDDDGNAMRDRRARHRVDADGRAATSSTRATRRRPTKSHDAEGFFTVGDIGYLNEDGYLFLCDRKSDMIIAGGVNIYPAEIEGEIHEHPQVADVAVFGIPDDDMGEQIKAVVEPLRRRRRRRRAARVDHGAHPAAGSASTSGRARIDFIDELPREPTGKLLKRKLRDPYWEGRRPRSDRRIATAAIETHSSTGRIA